jgi:hypothetical protein
MDATVTDELEERHARHLAAHRVKAGEHDRLGRVIDDEVDAGGLLQRTDVAPLAADDAALHLLVGEADHGDGGLGGVIGGDALHDRGEHPSRPLLALLLGVALDLAHPVLGLGLRLVHDLPDETLPRLGGGQTGDPLQLVHLPLSELGDLRPFGLELGQPRGEPLLTLFEGGDLSVE